MLDVGSLELFLIVAIALLVIGPHRLPEVARFLGRLYGQFQRSINRLREESQVDQYLEDLKKEINAEGDIKQELKTLADPVKQASDEINQTSQRLGANIRNLNKKTVSKKKLTQGH